MKIRILLIALIFILSRFGYSQTYFNNSYNFDLPNVLFTDIIISGDTIITLGPITSDTQPFFNSAISKFNLNGELIEFHKIKSDLQLLDLWQNKGIMLDSTILTSALIRDSISKVAFMEIDLFGNVDTLLKFQNPFAPSETFVVSSILEKINQEAFFFAHAYLDTVDKVTHINIKKITNLHVDTTILIKSDYGKILTASKIDLNGNLILGFSNLYILTKDFVYQNVVQKRDTSLNLIWEYKTPINSLLGTVGAITVTKDSGVVVSTMEGIESFVNPNVNQYVVKNIIFYKLDKNGGKIWETQFVRNLSHSSKFISTMKELPNGDILAAGQFFEIDNERGTIIKLSSEGDSLWQRFYTYPDKFTNFVHDMEILADGSILLAGENSDPQEGWLIAVDSMGCLIPNCITSIKEQNAIDAPLLRIYPNPVSKELHAQFKSKKSISSGIFRILSSSGQLMKEWKNNHYDHFIILDVQAYPAGQYFLQYQYDGKVVSESFVKI